MTKFKKTFLLLIGSEIIIVLVLGVILYEFRKDITQTVNQALAYKTDLDHRVEMMAQVHNLELESKTAQKYFTRLKQFLPTDSDMVSLEGVLHDLARKDSLNLSFRFGLTNKASHGLPPSYSFNLVLSGSSTNILKWFRDFYQLPYSFRLEQIEIRQDYNASNPANDHYTVKIIGRIYYRSANSSNPSK